MEKRGYDASLERMATDLSYARGSVKEVAGELGIDPVRLGKRRQKAGSPVGSTAGLTGEQKAAEGAGGGERKEQEQVAQIKKVYEQGKCRHGSPRVAAEPREEGILAAPPRVARLMGKHQLKSITRRQYRGQPTGSDPLPTVAESHLGRDFHAERPAEKWVSALTCIRAGEGWLHPGAVLDLAGRKGAGWHLSGTMKSEMVCHPDFATRQGARLAVFGYIGGATTGKGGIQGLGT